MKVDRSVAEGYRLTDERWCWQRVRVEPPDGSVRQLIIKYDAVDAHAVERYTWHAGADHRTFYAACYNGRRDERGWRAYLSMHALIMSLVDGGEPGDDGEGGRIAHLNGNGLDNRRANLKRMTQQQILAKRRPPAQTGGRPTSSRYKGVCWDREQEKWLAVFRGRKLGRFRDEQEAARAFDAAAFAQWGREAYLNFPGEQAS